MIYDGFTKDLFPFHPFTAPPRHPQTSDDKSMIINELSELY